MTVLSQTYPASRQRSARRRRPINAGIEMLSWTRDTSGRLPTSEFLLPGAATFDRCCPVCVVQRSSGRSCEDASSCGPSRAGLVWGRAAGGGHAWRPTRGPCSPSRRSSGRLRLTRSMPSSARGGPGLPLSRRPRAGCPRGQSHRHWSDRSGRIDLWRGGWPFCCEEPATG